MRSKFLYQIIYKTQDEFQKVHLFPATDKKVKGGTPHILALNVTYPSSLDWRMNGFVTKVSLC